MDIHKRSVFERLEIVETGRRRRWSEAEKLRIVMENQSAPRLVLVTARRYGISRSQLGTWLRSFRAGGDVAQPEPAFVPALIAPVAISQGDETAFRYPNVADLEAISWADEDVTCALMGELPPEQFQIIAKVAYDHLV